MPPADAIAATAVPATDPAAVGAGATPAPDATATGAAAVAVVTTGLATISSAAPPVIADPTRPVSADDGLAAAGPTQQIAAGLQALSRTTDGNRQLVMRLDPPELGRVQIVIAQPRDGPASVVLTVERPETLLLVLRDQPGLHQALDRAGVTADGRTVNFELAPVRAESQSTVPQAGHDQSGGGALDLDARQGGRSARQDPGAAANADPTGPDQPGDAAGGNLQPAWSRVGIDITA